MLLGRDELCLGLVSNLKHALVVHKSILDLVQPVVRRIDGTDM